MECVVRPLSILALALPIACSDPPTPATDGSSSGSDSGEPSPTSDDAASGSSAADDTTTTSSSSGDESSSSGETGESLHPDVELVVGAITAGGWTQYFYYAALGDGGTVGPIQITEPGDITWDVVAMVPGRRAAYRGHRVDGGDEIVLGAVDSDEMQVALDVPPVGTGDLGFPTPVPGGVEAVVFGEQETATIFRVDFPGGAPQAPVAVMRGVRNAEELAPLVDPTGRWLVDHVEAVEPGAIDLAVARLDVPDADGMVRLTSATGDAFGGGEVFTGDGNGLFYTYRDGTGMNELRHVDLRDDTPGDTDVVEVWTDESADYAFAAGDAGLVYSVAASGVWESSLWSTHASDDGSVAPPTLLLDEVEGTYWWMWTSADGRWMAFHVQVGGVERAYVLDVDDLAAPELHELELEAPGVAMFSRDSQWLFFAHDEPGGGSISRYPLEGGLGARELVAANDGVVQIGELRGITSDASTLLTSGYADDAPSQLVFDLGGPFPTQPTILNAPPPRDYWAQFGDVLRDDRHVAYIERNDVFGPERMMLADLDHPGEAIEVMSNTRGWIEVPRSP